MPADLLVLPPRPWDTVTRHGSFFKLPQCLGVAPHIKWADPAKFSEIPPKCMRTAPSCRNTRRWSLRVPAEGSIPENLYGFLPPSTSLSASYSLGEGTLFFFNISCLSVVRDQSRSILSVGTDLNNVRVTSALGTIAAVPLPFSSCGDQHQPGTSPRYCV